MFLSEGSYLSGGLGGLLASSLLNYDAVYGCTQHRHRISPSVVIIDFGKVQVIWHVFKGLLWASSLYACRIPPMPRSHPLNLLVFEGTEREDFSVVVIKALSETHMIVSLQFRAWLFTQSIVESFSLYIARHWERAGINTFVPQSLMDGGIHFGIRYPPKVIAHGLSCKLYTVCMFL